MSILQNVNIMRVQIKPTHQIQRINLLKNQLTDIRQLDYQLLMRRPREESWCCAEVLKHMFIAQVVYADKMNQALSKLKRVNEEVEVISSSLIPSYLIKRFPPIEGKIRFKMKTSKQFKPVLDIQKLTPEKTNEILDEMEQALNQLMSWIEETRNKDVQSIRFNSAIGPIVRFNVSEACEFILCHNERHFQQISNTLAALKNN